MAEINLGRKITSFSETTEEIGVYPARQTSLGSLAISRFLPVRERRLVGPWCFLDRFGPLTFSSGVPMNVPPHPHIGLQTVSWLLEGEVLHTDSLGSEALVKAGGVNVMTAGKGISHAEETPSENSGCLNGVQLWVALPDAVRHMEPAFSHVPRVPEAEALGGRLLVFAGSCCGAASPAPYHSGIVGLEALVHPRSELEIPLEPDYEHAVLLLEGDAGLDGRPLDTDHLFFLGSRRSGLAVTSQAGARILLIGGAPFREQVLMWWNFVARTHEELMGARAAWETSQYFGVVPGAHGERLAAPPPIQFARPNPAS